VVVLDIRVFGCYNHQTCFAAKIKHILFYFKKKVLSRAFYVKFKNLGKIFKVLSMTF